MGSDKLKVERLKLRLIQLFLFKERLERYISGQEMADDFYFTNGRRAADLASMKELDRSIRRITAELGEYMKNTKVEFDVVTNLFYIKVGGNEMKLPRYVVEELWRRLTPHFDNKGVQKFDKDLINRIFD